MGQAVQGLGGCGKNFGLYIESNGEPWKGLSSTGDMIRLVFSAVPAGHREWRCVNQ